MTAPLGNVKASVPPEQLKAKMNPGDVSFLGFERKDNVFTVTFAWIDMIGGHHEHTFARGDIFADFNKVLKVFTTAVCPSTRPKPTTSICVFASSLLLWFRSRPRPLKQKPKKKKLLLNNNLNT